MTLINHTSWSTRSRLPLGGDCCGVQSRQELHEVSMQGRLANKAYERSAFDNSNVLMIPAVPSSASPTAASLMGRIAATIVLLSSSPPTLRTTFSCRFLYGIICSSYSSSGCRTSSSSSSSPLFASAALSSISSPQSSSPIGNKNNNKTVLLHRLFSSSVVGGGGGNQQHPLVTVHHLTNPIESTQDEARRLLRAQHEQLLKQQEPPSSLDPKASSSKKTKEQRRRQRHEKCLAVTASEQLNGRGTQGRAWEGGNRKGNLYLTICIPMDEIPVKITLLPLQVAVLVADRVSKLLRACCGQHDQQQDDRSEEENEKNGEISLPLPKTAVKWPNDVLVDDRKISGTLIENEIVGDTTWLLIGVGINVAFAPSLENSPGSQLRAATCIQEYCDSHGGGRTLPNITAQALGADLAQALVEWALVDDDSDRAFKDSSRAAKEQKVIDDWKSFADFGKVYQLRADKVEDEDTGKHHGEKVVPIDIQNDGQLVVRGEDGRERLLVANYMF